MWSTEAGRAVMADTTLQSSSWGHELGFTWPPLLQVWPLEKSWTIHPLSKSCISKEIELWALLLEWLLRQGPKRGVEAQSLNTEVIKCLGQMVWGISLFWHGWEQGSTVPFWEPVCTFCTSQYGQGLVILDILHAWELRASHCSHLPPLKRPSVPAAEAEGHGMSLLEDNTASFLILPVSSPLENFFFFLQEYYFLLFLSYVAVMNLFWSSTSLSALTKGERGAPGRNSCLQLMLRNAFMSCYCPFPVNYLFYRACWSKPEDCFWAGMWNARTVSS